MAGIPGPASTSVGAGGTTFAMFLMLSAFLAQQKPSIKDHVEPCNIKFYSKRYSINNSFVL